MNDREEKDGTRLLKYLYWNIVGLQIDNNAYYNQIIEETKLTVSKLNPKNG